MAKKDKEAKKDKHGLVKKKIDKLGSILSKEVQKTVDQLQAVLGDFAKQAEELQRQVREPLKKFVQDLETLRDRELKRIQDEYQRAVGELNSLQEQIGEQISQRFGLTRSKPSAEDGPAKSASTQAPQAPAPASEPAGAPAAAPKRDTAPKGSKGAARAKSAKTSRPAKADGSASKPKAAGDDLTKLTGVGPALAKKLQEAGITRYQQIAEPSEEDRKVLDSFAKVRNSDKWADEAKALLAQGS